MRHFSTALRPYVQKRLEEIREADILVGIPCYNNEDTLLHVVQSVSHGIFEHFRDYRAVIMIADGGSTDDSRDRVVEFQVRPWQEKLVTVYRGVLGARAPPCGPSSRRPTTSRSRRACAWTRICAPSTRTG